jgi:hypothetical protein
LHSLSSLPGKNIIGDAVVVVVLRVVDLLVVDLLDLLVVARGREEDAGSSVLYFVSSLGDNSPNDSPSDSPNVDNILAWASEGT